MKRLLTLILISFPFLAANCFALQVFDVTGYNRDGDVSLTGQVQIRDSIYVKASQNRGTYYQLYDYNLNAFYNWNKDNELSYIGDILFAVNDSGDLVLSAYLCLYQYGWIVDNWDNSRYNDDWKLVWDWWQWYGLYLAFAEPDVYVFGQDWAMRRSQDDYNHFWISPYDGYYSISDATVAPEPLPEPSTMALLGTGIVGFLLVNRRNKRIRNVQIPG